jgi:hypothetical protein
MRSDLVNEFRRLMDNEVESRPSAMCFEFAYQGKIAMDRIKFAIKSVERFANHPGPALEANLQLLEALERLQSAERRFQDAWRRHRNGGSGESHSSSISANENSPV